MCESAQKHFGSEMPRVITEMVDLGCGKPVKVRLQLRAYFRKVGISGHLLDARLDEFCSELRKVLGNDYVA